MSNWEWKKLGDVCDIINGRNQKEVVNPQGAYPICGSGGVMGYADKYLCRENTVIIGRKGSINNPIYVQEKFWNVDTAFGLQSKDNYLPKLLYYFCIGYDFSKHNKGTTIPSLVKSDLLEIPIPVPPLAEQKRIVKTLDEKFAKIDKLKTAAETNLKNAKELLHLQYINEFKNANWEKKCLGAVYNFIDYRGMTPNKLKEGVPLITAKNVRMGYIDYSIRDYISEEDYKKRQTRGVAHKGDILFTTEAPLGFSAIADLDTFSTGQRIITFQQFENEKNVFNPFFYYYFQSPEFQKNIKDNATGLTATGIKASRLKEIKVPLPPLSEQKCIVAHLDKLSEKVKRLEENYTRTIADCEELKKSILKQVFEGDSRSSRE